MKAWQREVLDGFRLVWPDAVVVPSPEGMDLSIQDGVGVVHLREEMVADMQTHNGMTPTGLGEYLATMVKGASLRAAGGPWRRSDGS